MGRDRHPWWLLVAGGLCIGVAAAWFSALASIAVLFWAAAAGWLPQDALSAFVPVAFVTGIGSFGAYLWFGSQKPTAGEAGETRSRLLLYMPIAAAALLAVDMGARTLRDREQGARIEEGKARYRALAELKRTRFAPRDVQVSHGEGGPYVATATLTGMRAGRYLLRWRVLDAHYDRAIVEREERLDLTGPRLWSVSFSRDDLVNGYRAKVLDGNGARVLVEEDFRLRVTVTPDLDENARGGLPRYLEYRDLEEEIGAGAEAAFPVSFRLVA